jgi:hypothetical protein
MGWRRCVSARRGRTGSGTRYGSRARQHAHTGVVPSTVPSTTSSGISYIWNFFLVNQEKISSQWQVARSRWPRGVRQRAEGVAMGKLSFPIQCVREKGQSSSRPAPSAKHALRGCRFCEPGARSRPGIPYNLIYLVQPRVSRDISDASYPCDGVHFRRYGPRGRARRGAVRFSAPLFPGFRRTSRPLSWIAAGPAGHRRDVGEPTARGCSRRADSLIRSGWAESVSHPQSVGRPG